MSASITFVETVATAVISSGGVWRLASMFTNRRERKIAADNATTKAKQDELIRERMERERADLLAQSQSTAQRTALDSANARFSDLQMDHISTRKDLSELRQSTSLLINAFERFMMHMRPTADGTAYQMTLQNEEIDIARNTIQEARSHLF